MIFLQTSLFPIEFYLVIPNVILAHLCGVHYLFWQIQPRYSHFSTLGKIASLLGFAVVIWLAFYALPIWITIFGVVAKASTLAASNFTIGLVVLLFAGLMVLESFIVYHHLFKNRLKHFSKAYFALSVLISIIAFIATFAMFGFLTKDLILTELRQTQNVMNKQQSPQRMGALRILSFVSDSPFIHCFPLPENTYQKQHLHLFYPKL